MYTLIVDLKDHYNCEGCPLYKNGCCLYLDRSLKQGSRPDDCPLKYNLLVHNFLDTIISASEYLKEVFKC